jgi:hypothetical protein
MATSALDYYNTYPDLQEEFANVKNQFNNDPAAYAQWHYNNYGKNENRIPITPVSSETISSLQKATLTPPISALTPATTQVTANNLPSPLVLAPSANTINSLQSAANLATVTPVTKIDQAKATADAQAKAAIEKQLADKPYLLGLDTSGVQGDIPTAVWNASLSAKRQAKQEADDKEVRDYRAQLERDAQAKATADAQAASNTTGTTPSADTLANLGGTGTAKVADTGTVIDNTKLNTQGGGSALATGDASALSTGDVNKIPTTSGSALATGDVNKIATTGGSALSTGDVNKMSTSPAATSPPSTINTGSIPALTTADLTNWYNTQPKGVTSDQLTAALKTQQDTLNKSYTDALAGNQTALTSQNANFLKDWTTSADTLKNSILSGVDTKNQAFGTQATQGFMDAFKNFQIPTNQQTGVNLGNYNDNRNAAADQWWSQYVTGRR